VHTCSTGGQRQKEHESQREVLRGVEEKKEEQKHKHKHKHKQEEEEVLFKGKAVKEVNAEQDCATPAYRRQDPLKELEEGMQVLYRDPRHPV
jgi:hypothetical protein